MAIYCNKFFATISIKMVQNIEQKVKHINFNTSCKRSVFLTPVRITLVACSWGIDIIDTKTIKIIHKYSY